MATEKSIKIKPNFFVCYLTPILLAVGISLSSCRSYNKAKEVWEDDFVTSSWPGSGKSALPLTSLIMKPQIYTGGGFVFDTGAKPKVLGYTELTCGKQKVILSYADADAYYVDQSTMVTVFRTCIVLDVVGSLTEEPDSTCLKFIEACKSKNKRIVDKSYINNRPSDWVIQKLVER